MPILILDQTLKSEDAVWARESCWPPCLPVDHNIFTLYVSSRLQTVLQVLTLSRKLKPRVSDWNVTCCRTTDFFGFEHCWKYLRKPKRTSKCQMFKIVVIHWQQQVIMRPSVFKHLPDKFAIKHGQTFVGSSENEARWLVISWRSSIGTTRLTVFMWKALTAISLICFLCLFFFHRFYYFICLWILRKNSEHFFSCSVPPL